MHPFTNLWTVKLSDWQRGLIVAILTTPFTIIYDSVTATPMTLNFDWKKILGAAIAGGLGYFLKNFMTGANGQIFTNSPTPLTVSLPVSIPKQATEPPKEGGK